MTLFHITTHGCRVNRVESDSIAAELMSFGWEQAPLEQAEIALLNTCTVTGEADHKNRKAIRQALKRQGGPVLVTGCAINIAAEDYQAIDERVVCECDKGKVAARAAELMFEDGLRKSDLTPYGDGFRTRSGIKVQDGCDNACTFCIVHTARGKAHSMDPQVILAEAKELVAAGARELVLVGIDTGAYNWEGMRLDGLVELLLEQTEVGRIRIPSIEPQSITPELISLLADSEGRLCRHLHLVMQSGSSKVLREMARHYNADEFARLAGILHRAVPGIALSTDVIVGFPGETDEDFAETCKMVESCRFMKLHVFPYSKRPGTPAAAREDQIDPQTKAERAATLTALGQELALKDMERRLGTVESVIVERPGRGTTESFHEIRFDDELEIGALVNMKLTEIDAKRGCFVGSLT